MAAAFCPVATDIARYFTAPVQMINILTFGSIAAQAGDKFPGYASHLLAKSGGNVRQAARDARMDRMYLTELLRRHKLR